MINKIPRLIFPSQAIVVMKYTTHVLEEGGNPEPWLDWQFNHQFVKYSTNQDQKRNRRTTGQPAGA